MPLYEYRCQDCAHVFTRLQRVGAGSDGLSCPSCGSGRVERRLSTFASGPSSSGSVSPAPRGGSCGPVT